ncbi:Uma2 family endonuclease [Dankookia sp. GCM10030260]|uniref:Uma2 family endonuclease n=1 Tax=Dankookia sp. GCM10030260 TaxID=3273390 RepID=UPI0036206AF9
MTATAEGLWTEDSFLSWLESQERRHELVDGAPRAMVGATQRHDRVVTTLLVALATRLRGSPCRTGTADTAIRIPNRNIRYPDAAVDCGRFDETARVASEPTLVAEVLSPSTADFDRTETLEEYRSVPSLRHILIIDPDQPRLRLHTRGEDGHRTSAPHAGLDMLVPLPGLGIAVPLAEFYEGLSFRPQSRLVGDPPET